MVLKLPLVPVLGKTKICGTARSREAAPVLSCYNGYKKQLRLLAEV